MQNDLKARIEGLRQYFNSKPEIVMAFAFGSYVKESQTAESDFDVAVYFKPEGRAVEWEEDRVYAFEDRLWLDIEKITGIRTDLVVLNRAPATLAFSVLQDGIPIIIKNPSLYLNFFLVVSSAAEYFMEFTEDFWRIKQRAQSLSDVERNRLMRIVDFLEIELADYGKFSNFNQKDYGADAVLRRNVERWVENIVNSSIDIAKILLASEKKRIPQTYRQVLEGLSLLEGFDLETSGQLARFAKLRNILAHEYIDIRFNNINEFIRQSGGHYRYLSSFVKRLLEK